MILPKTDREPSLERVYHWEHLRQQCQFITKFQILLQCYTFCCNIGNVTPLQIWLECRLEETLVLTAASIFCYCSSDTLPCSTSHQTSRATALHILEKAKACHLNITAVQSWGEAYKRAKQSQVVVENIETLLSCQDQYAFPSSPLIHTRTQKSMTSNEYMRSHRTMVSRGTIKSICVARSLELWETWGPRHPQ